MIDNFVRYDFEFYRFTTEPESFSMIAHSDEDNDDIQSYYRTILKPKGWKINIYPIKKCSCGEEVRCTELINNCVCGLKYRLTGQERKGGLK